jgi:hypothetical protein
VTPCILVEIYQCFWGICLPDNTVSHLRTL